MALIFRFLPLLFKIAGIRAGVHSAGIPKDTALTTGGGF
jgi:hypothetical protein